MSVPPVDYRIVRPHVPGCPGRFLLTHLSWTAGGEALAIVAFWWGVALIVWWIIR